MSTHSRHPRHLPLGRAGALCALPVSLFLLLMWGTFWHSEGWRRLGSAVTVLPAGGLSARRDDGGGGGAVCDWSLGSWVRDERYPLYKAEECPFLDIGFRCTENGRLDRDYEKWRWQPSGCSLPRYNAKNLLRILQNRRLVFVGDSIGRNQWESLLCMLSTAIADKKSIYEVHGNPITKHMGFLIFMFRDFNCTIEYYRSPFIVQQSRAPEGVPDKVKSAIKVDAMDWMSDKWKGADILVFNTGHWWTYEKTIRGGCYFQEGDEIKWDMSIQSAYERSLMTLREWLEKEIDESKTQVVFRTYAPAHFRGEDWRNGANCHRDKFPDLDVPSVERWAKFLKPLDHIFLWGNPEKKLPNLDILNITQMTAQRKDGHQSLYYLGFAVHVPLHRQDCSHWCLPGVPDTWNELLYALILKRETLLGVRVAQ